MFPTWGLLCLIAAALIAVGLYTEKNNPDWQPKPDSQPADPTSSEASQNRSDPYAARRWGQRLAHWPRRLTIDQWLFGLAIGIYLLVMLVGLDRFPIYFFSDEAINTMLASDFVRDGFRDYDGQLFPAFFKNYDKYNLSTSVYLQVLPAALFKRSVSVTRGAAALATLLAAVSIALILKRIYQISAWWSGILLLAATPAWMLHARTAFETALMASCFAASLYFYLRYRTGHPRNLTGAVLFAAAAFYTYSPARVIIPLAALVLFVFDFRYHWQHKRLCFANLLLGVICALPFLRFFLTHPGASTTQLYNQASYWFTPQPLPVKLGQYLRTYLQGLNPLYWYFPGDQDLVRHRFDALGHLWLPALPLLLLGGYDAIRHFRRPAYRDLWLMLLVIPTGAALIDVGITRLLALIIPVVILQGLGTSLVVDWIGQKLVSPRAAAVSVFSVLCLVNFWMLNSAFSGAPTWTQDYGLTGMQWGARQIFTRLDALVVREPGVQVVLSPTWANGTDTLARFFMSQDPPPITLASIDHYLNTKVPNIDDILFVLPEYEFTRASSSGKFTTPKIIDVLHYPDGRPGFFFTHLKYVPEIDALLAAEEQLRVMPETKTVTIDGETVEAAYSPLDIGEIQMAFDGDPRSLCRTQAANPAVIELTFPKPRRIAGLALIFGSTQVEVTVSTAGTAGQEKLYHFRLTGSELHPQGDFTFPEPLTTDQLHIEILDMQQGQPGNVHFWEITFY
ncbi:MAG: ArnT family glycosyltransferase [Anaerolineales bacterium]